MYMYIPMSAISDGRKAGKAFMTVPATGVFLFFFELAFDKKNTPCWRA
jgi:hypothetical protein